MPLNPETDDEALPRGPHALSREQVQAAQQQRLLKAMAYCVGEKGYLQTSVADVLGRAGVSRATFYALFKDKESCFIVAYQAAAEQVVGAMLRRLGEPNSGEHEVSSAGVAAARGDAGARLNQRGKSRAPAEVPASASSEKQVLARLERLFSAYLASLTEQPQIARTFLVEVFAAGPEAIRSRHEYLDRFIQIVLSTLAPLPAGSPPEAGAAREFAVRALVHSVSSMVTLYIGSQRTGELESIKQPLLNLAEQLLFPQP